MRNIVRKIVEGAKSNVLTAEKKHACQVVITCGQPNKEGKMDVEMTYDGDPCLAAYLIDSAQSYVIEDDFQD